MTRNSLWIPCVVAVLRMIWRVLSRPNIFSRKFRFIVESFIPSKDLKSTLRGQVMKIPDLTKLYTHWPAPRLSSHLNELRLIHDEKVQGWFPDEKVRRKMIGIDVPLFAAM